MISDVMVDSYCAKFYYPLMQDDMLQKLAILDSCESEEVLMQSLVAN